MDEQQLARIHPNAYRRGETITPRESLLSDLPDPDMNDSDMPLPMPRCPVCGGLNPGDITHTRC